MIHKHLLLSVVFTLLVLPILGRAQDDSPASVDSTLEIARAGMQAQRAAIVGEGMNFSDRDAAAFWPIYRQYEYERSRLDDGRVAVIKEYIDKYPDLTDAEAKAMADRMFEYESHIAALKKKYFKKFNNALPALTVTKFFQLERRIDLTMAMKIEAALPPLTEVQDADQSKQE
jgi:hypothetical protein